MLLYCCINLVKLAKYNINSTVEEHSPGVLLFLVQVTGLRQHLQNYCPKFEERYLWGTSSRMTFRHQCEVLVQIPNRIVCVQTVNGALEHPHDTSSVCAKSRSTLRGSESIINLYYWHH